MVVKRIHFRPMEYAEPVLSNRRVLYLDKNFKFRVRGPDGSDESLAGSVTSTSDGDADPGVILKTDSSGAVKVTTVNATSAVVFGGDGSIAGSGDEGLHIWSMPQGDGRLALTSSDDGKVDGQRSIETYGDTDEIADDKAVVIYTSDGGGDLVLPTGVAGTTATDGHKLVVRNIGDSAVTLQPGTGYTIENGATFSLASNAYATFVLYGSNWHRIG